MEDWVSYTISAIIFGSLYGWLSARSSMKKLNDFMMAIGLLNTLLFLLVGWMAATSSMGQLALYVIIAFVSAFIVNMRTNTRHERKVSPSSQWSGSSENKLDKYADTISVAGATAAEKLKIDLSLSENESTVWMVDFFAYSLYLTFKAIQVAKLDKPQYKSIIQGTARRIASNVGKGDEETYQMLMSSLATFTQNYGDYKKANGSELKEGTFLYETSKGLLKENLPHRHSDRASIEHVAQTLRTIEQFIDSNGFAHSMK